jgi:hypothetical protein
VEAQGWVEVANSLVAIADGTALASSATIGTISPNSSTNPPITFGANTLFPGAAIRVTASGRFSNTGTPTLNIGLYWNGSGGTALATTGAITTTSGVTNVPWRVEALIVCRAIGSSGTLFTQGFVHGISGTTGVSVVPLPASAPAAVTVSTVAAASLDLTATWGTSSASNTITCHQFLVEALNFNPV